MFIVQFLAFWLLAAATPSSCAKVKFAINLTWDFGSPDGQPRKMIYTNGQFPGPKLTLDYGDDVEVSTLEGIQGPVNLAIVHGI